LPIKILYKKLHIKQCRVVAPVEVKGYKNILNLPDFQKKSYPAIKPETRQRIRGKIMACARLFFF